MKTYSRTLVLLHSFFVVLIQAFSARSLPGVTLLFMLTVLLSVSACESNDPDANSDTPKNIPQNITINPGTRVIELAWSGVSGASGYSVYWSNQANVSPSQGTLISTTEPYLEHRGLANGQRYYYVITARTAHGESPASAAISALPQTAAPAKPSQLSAYGGDARVTLQWEPVPGATHYTLYWNTLGTVGDTVSDTDARIDRVVSPFVHSDLSNGQNYYYILVAENAAGSGSASAEVSTQAQQPAPSAPVIEQVTDISSAQATLHWGNSSNASGYTLYWNTRGDVSTDDAAIAQVTSPYTVAPLSDSVIYYYRLQAHNVGGDSPLSNEAQISPPDNHVISAPGAAPGVPADVVVRLGNGQLSLDWPVVEGALGYNLYWSSASNDEIVPGVAGVKKLAHLQPPYTHIRLNNGSTYRYRLSAFNHQGESALSTEVSGTPQVIMPGVPAGVRAINGDERVAVRWNAVQGASGYTLYFDNQQGDARVIPNVSSPYAVDGLSNNTAYAVQVTAYNVQGESERSAVITATPHEPVPNAPQRLSAQPGNGRVLLQWDSALAQDPDDSAQLIRGYRVYYDTRNGVRFGNRTLLSESDSEIDAEFDIVQTADGRWQLDHTGLNNGQRYYYVVSAFNDGGESGASTEMWARPEVPIPDAPSQVWAAAGDNQVVIHFTEVDSDAAPTYNLYWNKQLTNGVSSTTVITNIQPGYLFSEGADTNGQTYQFQISAFNVGGESALTPEVSASPQVPPPARPPQDLLSSAQPGQVTLNWSPSSDASGYVIYWSTDPEIDPNTSARFSGDEVQPGYLHTGLANGQTYYYQVTAVNPGGESALSQTLIARPQINPPATPDTPSLSTADASVSIDFQAVDGATSYTLFWHTDPDVDVAQWSQKHGVQSGDRLGNFANGQTYYFQLAANNDGGQSAPSAISSAVVPQASVPATPSGVSAIAGDGRISLNWPTQPDVTYTLYWSDDVNVEPINSSSSLIDNVRPRYAHTGLSNNTLYRYQLTARNSRGDSAASAVISATPKAQNPNPVNQAPQISEGAAVSVTLDEDAEPTPFSLSLTASDADNDPLSWSVNQASTQGTASVLGDTNASTVSIGYTPNANYNGIDSFAIEVSDDQGGMDVISVNVTINPQNDAPVINAQTPATITTPEETALTLALSHLVVSDPDNAYPGDFSLAVQASSGYTLSGNTITPDANVTGNLSVPVSVTDGNSQSNVFTVNVDVSNTNDAPVAVNDSYTLIEGGTLSTAAPGLLSNDTDADNDNLSVTPIPVSLPNNGSVTLNTDGSFTYVHDGSETSSDRFMYEITDGLMTATAVVSITITAPQNNTPVITSPNTATIAENTTAVMTVTATDADNDPLTYTLSGGADQTLFVIDGNSGALAFITVPVFATPADVDGDNVYQVEVSVSDANTAVTQGISVSISQVSVPLAGLFADEGLQRCVDEKITQVYAHEVTSLTCSGYGISDLVGIGYLTNLRSLNLNNNQLVNLNGLAGADLSSLTDLELSGNQLTDISGLASAGLSDLRTLSLSSNQLANLNGLVGADLNRLVSLSVSNNQLTDIGGLASAGLGNLQVLLLANNKLANLNGLAGADLSRLTSLRIFNNQLTDISGLASAGLSNLTSLDLNSNQLANLDGLAGADLSSLTDLSLGRNQLTDISGLASAGLRNLESLVLDNNKLANLSGLAGSVTGGVILSSLTSLIIGSNQLTDISGLANVELGNLTLLDLNNNAIADVSVIANFTSIRQLRLVNNSIGGLGVGRIDSLIALTNATSIDLSNNPTMSCFELQSLISGFGLNIVTPSTVEDGVTCTIGLI